MQEMTKDEQIAVMQAKIDEMTSAIFAKDRKIEELRKATADRNALEQECIQLRADKKRLRETKREACEALRAKEKELSKLFTLYGDKCFTEWQLRTQMAKNKEWYNRPWYKKLAWRVKLMFS